jgi:hypothetical protein
MVNKCGGGLVVLLLLGSACSKGAECGEGTVLKDGKCVVQAGAATKEATPEPPAAAPAGTAAGAERRAVAKQLTNEQVVTRTSGEDDTVLEFKATTRVCKLSDLKDTVSHSGQAMVKMGFTRLKCMDSGEYVDLDGTPAAPAAAAVAAPNEPVKFPHSEWTVVSATWKGRHLPSNNQFQGALDVEEGKLLQVQYKVRNGLPEKAEVRPPKLRDSKGRIFEPLEHTAFYIPQGKKTPNIMAAAPPALATEYWGAYQVADDSTDLVLLAHDLGGDMFDRDDPNVKPIALGLQ